MEENAAIMTVDNICNRVYVIRGQQVMLDYGFPMEQLYHCGASSKDADKKIVLLIKLKTRK